jgi:hypothetical protein
MDAMLQQLLRHQHAGIAIAHDHRGDRRNAGALHGKAGLDGQAAEQLHLFMQPTDALGLALQDIQRRDGRRRVGR